MVHGVRVAVAASHSELLRAALAELPAAQPATVAGDEISIGLTAGPDAGPAPRLRRGVLGLDYLLSYPDLWLRSASGCLFRASAAAQSAVVQLPEAQLPAAGREVGSGMGIVLHYLLRETGFSPVHAACVRI